MKSFYLIPLVIIYLFLLNPTETLAYNSPDFHGSSISPTMSGSDQVPADGVTNAVMTVTVIDSFGTALSGDVVSVLVQNDTSAVVVPSSTGLDSFGKAIFYIKSTKEGVASLDIIDRTQNVTLSGIGHITFLSTTCTASIPTGPPKLISAIAISNTQIKLTWTKAPDPVTFYTVYYGTSKGNYIYGNPNVGDANTTTYTVGNLNTGETYFFIVIPGNVCILGPISNELSAKALVSVVTPVPTQIPTDTPSQNPTVTYQENKDIIANPTPVPVDKVSSSFIFYVINSPLAAATVIATAGGILLFMGALFVYRRR